MNINKPIVKFIYAIYYNSVFLNVLMYNLQYWFIKDNDIDQIQVFINVLDNKK